MKKYSYTSVDIPHIMGGRKIKLPETRSWTAHTLLSPPVPLSIVGKGSRVIVRTGRTRTLADRTICAYLVKSVYFLGTYETRPRHTSPPNHTSGAAESIISGCLRNKKIFLFQGLSGKNVAVPIFPAKNKTRRENLSACYTYSLMRTKLEPVVCPRNYVCRLQVACVNLFFII